MSLEGIEFVPINIDVKLADKGRERGQKIPQSLGYDKQSLTIIG